MFGGDRGDQHKARLIVGALAVAILLTGLIAIAYGLIEQSKYNWAAYERAQEYAADTYGPKYNACFRLPALSQINCISNAKDEWRENARKESDLVAQQTMAVWTSLMGGAAIVGMILSSVGVYLVYTTFGETRKQATEAARANADARYFYERQNRPMLTPSFGTSTITIDDASVTFSGNISISSSGHFDAENVMVGARLFMSNEFAASDAICSADEMKDFGPTGRIAAIEALRQSERRDTITAEFPLDQVRNTLRHEKFDFFPVLAVTVTYVWGTDRTASTLCWQFAVNNANNGFHRGFPVGETSVEASQGGLISQADRRENP